jgi:hypothetical protein
LVSRTPNAIPVFVLTNGVWQKFGAFISSVSVDATEVRAAVDADDYAAVAPVTPDLRVGNNLFRFGQPQGRDYAAV